MSTPSNTARPSGALDLVRQLVVIMAVVLSLAAGYVGTGATGGKPVNQAFMGALDSDGSFVAPARGAFSIWLVVYAGLLAYAIWQALPAQRGSARQRAMGWWIALAVLLNAAWNVTVQLGSLIQTVVVIVLLLVVLSIAFARAVRTRAPEAGLVDSVLIDGVTGLHFGWVLIATVANVAGWITFIAANTWPRNPAVWGAATVALVALVAVLLAIFTRGRIAPSLAIAWGLAWIAVARAFGEPYQSTTALAAAIAAAVVLLVTLGIKAWRMYQQGLA